MTRIAANYFVEYIYSRLFKFLEFYAVIQNGGGRARLINRSIELDGSEK